MTQPSISIVLILSFSYLLSMKDITLANACPNICAFSSSLMRVLTITQIHRARSHPYPYSTPTSNEVFILASRWAIHLQNPISESASLKHSWYKLHQSGFLRNRLWDGSCLQKVYWGVLLRDIPVKEWESRNGERERWTNEMVAVEASAYFMRSSGAGWPFRDVANWGKRPRFLYSSISWSTAAGYPLWEG